MCNKSNSLVGHIPDKGLWDSLRDLGIPHSTLLISAHFKIDKPLTPFVLLVIALCHLNMGKFWYPSFKWIFLRHALFDHLIGCILETQNISSYRSVIINSTFKFFSYTVIFPLRSKCWPGIYFLLSFKEYKTLNMTL